MIRRLAPFIVTFALLLGTSGAAFAANPHSAGVSGPPNMECEDFVGFTPGQSAGSAGAAFNPDGTGHNAYEAAGAPSQYDVACFQQAQK